MNKIFVLRGLLVALPTAALITAVGLVLFKLWASVGPPPDPTPPPPVILAPRGETPSGPVGLQELARRMDEPYSLRGCGFLLKLSGGRVVGVTTAHSLPIDDYDDPLERAALRVAGETEPVAEFDTLWGKPGRARTGTDMRVDYVLLKADRPVDPDLLLAPDPRGAPQPGERVALFSGLEDEDGGRRVLGGTVQSVGDEAVWVLMDDFFFAGMMSGSPFVSQHTGKVVGMLIAGNIRGTRLMLGMHPIGSIVSLAESAEEFPRLNEYRR